MGIVMGIAVMMLSLITMYVAGALPYSYFGAKHDSISRHIFNKYVAVVGIDYEYFKDNYFEETRLLRKRGLWLLYTSAVLFLLGLFLVIRKSIK